MNRQNGFAEFYKGSADLSRWRKVRLKHKKVKSGNKKGKIHYVFDDAGGRVGNDNRHFEGIP